MLRSFEDIEIARAKRETFIKSINHIFLTQARNLEKNVLYLKNKYKLSDRRFFIEIRKHTGYDLTKYDKFETMYRMSKPYPEKIMRNAALVGFTFNIDVNDLLTRDIEALDKRNALKRII
jgi:hypothetical protein